MQHLLIAYILASITQMYVSSEAALVLFAVYPVVLLVVRAPKRGETEGEK
jgi:hypothetical protein